MNSPKDSKKRFSGRVDNYVKYRPSYPKEAIDFLYNHLGFSNQSIIADLGSGTGIFTKLLLDRGNLVRAIEPNNEMREALSPFDQEYDGMLKEFGTDYELVMHAKINEKDFKEFFKEGHYKKAVFANRQVFDFAGLQGRLLSSSYIPLPGETKHDELMQELRRIFDLYHENGMITLFYDTELFYGEIGR